MTGEELKSSVLKYAIQGKLVEQREDEGTAEELYQQIISEKQKLIKEGKIKKSKSLPEINEDEVPFEIPDTWKWVRLGEFSQINGGYAFKSYNFKKTGVRVIRISDFSSEGISNKNIVRHDYDKGLEKYIVEENNILLCMTGGTVGKSYFIEKIEEPLVTNQRVATIKISNILNSSYVNYVILSEHIQNEIIISANSTNDNISMELIKNFLIPLPPLREQERIVERFQEIYHLIVNYANEYKQLKRLNQDFATTIDKSILKYAIQGKLLEQREDEGTAEELYQEITLEKKKPIKEGKIKKIKSLPEINEKEIPFEIPETWKWLNTSSLFKISTGKKDVNVNVKKGKYIFFTCAKEPFRADTYEFDGECLILPGNGANVGLVTYYNGKFEAYQRTYVLEKLYGQINIQYILIVFKAYWKEYNTNKMYGSATPYIKLGNLQNFLIPLPPLREQERIVREIDNLSKLTKSLKIFIETN